MLLLKLQIDCNTQSCLLLKPQDNCTIQSHYCLQIINTCTYKRFISHIYDFFVHSSTVAAILYQLSTTSNPKTVGGMCDAILDEIGLRSHHGTNYKYLPIMARLTTDTLG